jgi:5-methylcytosine-specific restriction endonuclease McrA
VNERTWIVPEDRKPLTRKQVVELFLRQDGLCPICGQKLQTKGHTPVEFIDEHMTPLWRNGSNELRNRSLVCKPCAKSKTSEESTDRAKGYRVRDKHIKAPVKKQSRQSPYRKKMDGTVVWRETGEPVR